MAQQARAVTSWLETEPLWKSRLGNEWVGRKMLGQGGQGMVGLWSYEGSDRDSKSPKDIAVKQTMCMPGCKSTLEGEARFLQMFQDVATPHIIKMYGRLYEDEGQSGTYLDRFGSIVNRIYLEYCPLGDLERVFLTYNSNPVDKMVPEDMLWALLHCLAKGVLVMKHGSEDPKAPKFNDLDGEMVHFDLKLENILVGNRGEDREHGRGGPFKITDFGCTKLVPRDHTKAYIEGTGGTIDYLLPEQVRKQKGKYFRPWNTKHTGHDGKSIPGKVVKNPQLGVASNIWHIGLIMAQPDISVSWWDSQTPIMEIYHSKLNSNLREKGYTLSVKKFIELETRDPKSLPYSQTLHGLVAGCLMIEPSDRISPETLVLLTRGNHNLWQQAQGSDIERSDTYPEFSEPRLSDRWYSGQKRTSPQRAEERNAKRSRSAESPIPEVPSQLAAPRRPSPPTISVLQAKNFLFANQAIAAASGVLPPRPQSQRPNVRPQFVPQQQPLMQPPQPQLQPPAQPEPQPRIPHQRRSPPPLPPNNRPSVQQTSDSGAQPHVNHQAPSLTNLAEDLIGLNLNPRNTASDVRPQPLYRHQLDWEPTPTHHLGPNMTDVGTYKTLRFMIRKGEWSHPKAQGEVTCNGWGKGENVMHCKTELAKGRGMRAAEMVFRCGMRGEVMENERRMGDYPGLERDGIVEVLRIPALLRAGVDNRGGNHHRR